MQIETQQSLDAEISFADAVKRTVIFSIQRENRADRELGNRVERIGRDPAYLQSQPARCLETNLVETGTMAAIAQFVVSLAAGYGDSHDLKSRRDAAKGRACQSRAVWFVSGTLMSFFGVNAFSGGRSRGELTASVL